jgi:hypothetical protein
MVARCVVCIGRGSTRPFHLFGAPWFEPHAFIQFIAAVKSRLTAAATAAPAASALHAVMLSERCRLSPPHGTAPGAGYGLCFSAYQFRPTFNKFMGQICHALLITPTLPVPSASGAAHSDDDTHAPNLYALGVLLMLHCVLYYPTHFQWRPPSLGYEYNFTEPAINLLLGTRSYKKWWDELQPKAAAALPRGSAQWTALVTSAIDECVRRLGESWTDAQLFAREAKQFFLY